MKHCGLLIRFVAVLCIGVPTAFAAESGAEAGRIKVFESSLRPAISIAGEPETHWQLAERMDFWKVPGLSVVVIRDGKIAWAKGFGVLQQGKAQKIDEKTVFSVGSVSKVATAAISLRMVDARKLDLDKDINEYLTRWKLPGNQYTLMQPVTLRGILTHTAGLSVHGFGDFQPGEKLPTVFDTLDGRAPASEPVRVLFKPGSKMKYSGGGITIEQLMIEDVSGEPFTQAAKRYVFEPLRMERSTFENPLPEQHGNIAKAHGDDGKPRALPRGYESMPEMAASGLWTTATDLGKLAVALIDSYKGQKNGFISSPLARQMMTGTERSYFGLGPIVEGYGRDQRFYHGGANDSYRAWIEGHLGTGGGVVILTNSARGDALIAEVRRAVAVSEGWSPALSFHEQVPNFSPADADLDEMVGVYELGDSGIAGFRYTRPTSLRVMKKDGGLYLIDDQSTDGLAADKSADAKPHRRLTPVDASHFVAQRGNAVVNIEFVRNYRGRICALLMRNGGGSVVLEAWKTPR